MTGHKCDAEKLDDIVHLARSEPHNGSKTFKKPLNDDGTNATEPPALCLRSRKSRYILSDSKEDDVPPWDYFNQVEKESALRPNPPRTKWFGEPATKFGGPNNRAPRQHIPDQTKKRDRSDESDINQCTSQKFRRSQSSVAQSRRVPLANLDTDSDTPLIRSHTARNHRPSPPTTQTQSIASIPALSTIPTQALDSSTVVLLSDSEGEQQPAIKCEPLSTNARAGTILKVSMHTQPERLEISVPLGDCKTSGQLFDKLTAEWRLRPELAKKVNFISATYRWSGEPHGMRRGVASDWKLFCSTIREAWDKEEDTLFKSVVEMKLISDD